MAAVMQPGLEANAFWLAESMPKHAYAYLDIRTPPL